MPNTFLEPATDHVLVVDSTFEPTTINGIDMPDNEKQKEMITGTVVFVGPAVSPLTKPEAIVLYGPYAGKTVVFNGTAFRLLREGQIELYIRKSN
jgi:co-chaperonin GroES (HSP10)